MRPSNYLVLMAIILLTLPACFSSGIPNSKAFNKIAIEEAQKSTKNPSEAVNELKKSIDEAKHTIQLDYYAPRHLSSAEKALSAASDLLVKKAEAALILQETIKAHKFLSAGKNIKLSVQRHLKTVFEEKEWLDSINAKHYLPDDYNDSTAGIAELIDEIETGDIESALSKQNELFKEMIDLEIDVMKVKHLNEAKSILKKALRIDGHKLAPSTYTHAEQTLESAEEFIEMNSRDLAGIKRAGEETLAACMHTFHITEAVIKLMDTDEDDYENYILDFETLMNRISLAANSGSLKHMSLYEQSAHLAKIIEANRVVKTVTTGDENNIFIKTNPETDTLKPSATISSTSDKESTMVQADEAAKQDIIKDQPEQNDTQPTMAASTEQILETSPSTKPVHDEKTAEIIQEESVPGNHSETSDDYLETNTEQTPSLKQPTSDDTIENDPVFPVSNHEPKKTAASVNTTEATDVPEEIEPEVSQDLETTNSNSSEVDEPVTKIDQEPSQKAQSTMDLAKTETADASDSSQPETTPPDTKTNTDQEQSNIDLTTPTSEVQSSTTASDLIATDAAIPSETNNTP